MQFSDEISSLQPGINIGSMQITGFVGKGAIGEVYECIDEETGERFAVKICPKAFGAEGLEILEREAEYQASLEHPNIVRVDQFGEEDLFYWFRMEFISGEEFSDGSRLRTLADLAKKANGYLTTEEVIYYFYFLLLGLDHGHSLGLAHDNLKPENIFLVDEGAKLSDYGTTRFVGHAWDDFFLLRDDPLMEPTPFDPLPGFSRALPSLITTYDYFAPERKAGAPGDALSDLYSLGVIALRMLTGRNAMSIEVPSDVNRELNGSWDEWLVRATAYERSQRFQSAAEMLRAIPGIEVAGGDADQRDAFFEGQDTLDDQEVGQHRSKSDESVKSVRMVD
ncbi:MAG: serine/threonine protein kinase [Puniceicoccaceae bacterium]